MTTENTALRAFTQLKWDITIPNADASEQLDIFARRFDTSTAEVKNRGFRFVTTFVADCAFPIYKAASHNNGDFVTIDRQYSYLPLLWGNDRQPVFVYEVVEELEGVLDFGELQSRFPTLSYAQIVGAVGFLRSLAQFNRKGIEIDALVDEAIESDPEFQSALKQAMEDQEAVRVLAPL